MVKILSIEMSMKRGLNEGTLRETLMMMRYLTIVNLMQTMLLFDNDSTFIHLLKKKKKGNKI